MSVASDVVQQALDHVAALPVDPSLAFLFPGQGCQKVGMGRDLTAASAAAGTIYRAAADVLGQDVARLCFEGPENELTRTVNAQPAILVTSVAGIVAAVETGKVERCPAFLAGHSLGEYSALVIAGALAYEDALLLVRERGRLMEEAGRESPGTMAALVALDEATAVDICRICGAEIANYNSPTQFVIGGTSEAVDSACALARERGGRGLPLPVSGAFHTSLMREAALRFAGALEGAPIRDAAIPVVANATARPLTSAGDIREELLEQVLRPVLWQQSIRAMTAAGVRSFVESGPGRVLTAMLKRADPGLEALSLESQLVGTNV